MVEISEFGETDISIVEFTKYADQLNMWVLSYLLDYELGEMQCVNFGKQKLLFVLEFRSAYDCFQKQLNL